MSGSGREQNEATVEERAGPYGNQEAAASNPKETEGEPADKMQKASGPLGKSGGAYIPPARLAMMQREISDKSSDAFQRVSWEALKKSINGLINKVNTSNIKHIVTELFAENLIRGRGLFARSCIKAQGASLPFTAVFAALVSIINTKLPQVGELVLKRLIIQFRKSYRRNDKSQCLATTMFIAHLVNHRVAHEILSLQILTLLLERPTDDSVEIAIGFMRESGAFLAEISPKPANAIFELFRSILHDAQIDKRVQYMIEVLFQVRKDKFKDNLAIKPELDLVEEEDQITHYVSLEDEIDPEDGLLVYKFDSNYLENEDKYAKIKYEIVGDEDEEEEESSEDEAEEQAQALTIQDQTSTNLINLRKTIYLTIMSSADFEECCHKLSKIQLPPGHEIELCNMIIESCSQERTYLKFYGLMAERFCNLDPQWQERFEYSFEQVYKTIHRMETNRIRNVAKLFGHLLNSDSILWDVLKIIRLNENETTAASRIFIKILYQELCESWGLKKFLEKIHENKIAFSGSFPIDNPRNTRFAINFFTAIGLGGVTDEMREYLKNAPKMIVAPPLQQQAEEDEESTSSEEEMEAPQRRSPSPDRERRRERSRSRSKERRSERDRRHRRSRSRDQRDHSVEKRRDINRREEQSSHRKNGDESHRERDHRRHEDTSRRRTPRDSEGVEEGQILGRSGHERSRDRDSKRRRSRSRSRDRHPSRRKERSRSPHRSSMHRTRSASVSSGYSSSS